MSRKEEEQKRRGKRKEERGENGIIWRQGLGLWYHIPRPLTAETATNNASSRSLRSRVVTAKCQVLFVSPARAFAFWFWCPCPGISGAKSNPIQSNPIILYDEPASSSTHPHRSLKLSQSRQFATTQPSCWTHCGASQLQSQTVWSLVRQWA